MNECSFSSDVEVNVRVMSSTARDLRDAISQGRFREDLFHRLNVVPIRAPALSERRDDVPMLVEYFSKRVADANGVSKIKAKSLLAGGESGDLASKHFNDQLEMYTKGQFKDVLFYKEDVLKNMERTYHPGE